MHFQGLESQANGWNHVSFLSVCSLGTSVLYGRLLWCFLKGGGIALEIVLLTGYKLTGKAGLMSSSCFQINLTTWLVSFIISHGRDDPKKQSDEQSLAAT